MMKRISFPLGVLSMREKHLGTFTLGQIEFNILYPTFDLISGLERGYRGLKGWTG